MRIAFHVPRAFHLGTEWFSGDNVQVAGLIGGLREQGHQVEIVTRLDARELGRRRVPAHRLVGEAIRVRRRMRRFAPEAWVVYMPSVTYPDLFGWWQRPARYVVFAGDKGRPERLPLRWRALFAAAHKRSLLAADTVTVYRPRGAARVRSLGVAPERVVLLPPAVTAPGTIPSKEEARRTLGLPLDVPIVLCVSRFTRARRKDGRAGKTAMILDLLGVVGALPPPVLCVIVGTGSGQKEVEEERARLGLEERVLLAGRVPDVNLYYAACDVFAYPYDLDRPWVSVLEAQACGRPVVTMRTDSAELTVEDGRTGLLANDLDDFRTQLAALTADLERCESMGRAARDFIARSHTIGIRVGQIEELLSGNSPR